MAKQIFELRGHHIHHLVDYLTTKKYEDLTLYGPSEEEILEYGQKYCDNRGEVLKKIVKEDSLIRIIAKHDSFCNKCDFKIKCGCLKKGVLYKQKKTGSIKDKEGIRYFGLKLNKIYTGKELSTLLT